MAKQKRARQKFHLAAQKTKKDEFPSKALTSEDSNMVVDSDFKTPSDPTAGVARGDNLFKDVKISGLNLLAQKLPDFDAMSSITSKTFKGQNLKKKEKSQLRKEAWMAKMDTIQIAKKKDVQRKKNQKTVIVGDLTPMEDALPTLELLLKKSAPIRNQQQIKEKPRSIAKEKNRKKQMLDDISLFHRVHQHPMFKEDAISTVTDHLRVKIQDEQEAGS